MLGALILRAPDGRTAALHQVAHVEIAAGQRQITREDLAPFIAVTARLEGLDLGSGMKAVQTKVGQLHLPATIRIDYGARLRPILMSALIAILTLLPLALGLGRGSGLQRPLATAIIAGLAIGAPLVLTLLPGLILLLGRIGASVRTTENTTLS